MLPDPLQNLFPFRNEKIGGKHRENHIYQNIWNISGDTAGRCHRRSSYGTDHITEGIRKRVNQSRQAFCQVRRETRHDSLQVIFRLRQILEQSIVQFRQRPDKTINFPYNSGYRKIPAHCHQCYSSNNNQHGTVLPDNFHPLFHKTDQRIRDHGNDPSYDQRHEKHQESRKKKTDQKQCRQRQ